MCFVLLELSILNRLHKESRLTDDPGNLSRAKINVSTISFLITSLPSKLSSLFNEINQIRIVDDKPFIFNKQ